MFGEAIRKLRKDKKVTQAALAEMLGLTQQTIGKWETGVATPSLDVIRKIAGIFDVPIGMLIGEAEREIAFGVSDLLTDLDERQIKAIGELITLFEVRMLGSGIIEVPQHRNIVEAALRENDDVMTLAHNAISLVLDALIICSLELSKIRLDKSIAHVGKEDFDEHRAYEEAKMRVAPKIINTAELTQKILTQIPGSIFTKRRPTDTEKGGESNGEHP